MRDNFIHTRRAYWPPLCTQTMQGYVCTPSYSALLGSSSGTTFATDLRNRHTHRCYNSIQFLILTMCMCIFHVRFHDWKSAQGDPSCPFRLNLNPSLDPKSIHRHSPNTLPAHQSPPRNTCIKPLQNPCRTWYSSKARLFISVHGVLGKISNSQMYNVPIVAFLGGPEPP